MTHAKLVVMQLLVGVLLSLKSANMVNVTITPSKVISLTDEGKSYLELGSPEAVLFNAIPSGGISQNDLFVSRFPYPCCLRAESLLPL